MYHKGLISVSGMPVNLSDQHEQALHSLNFINKVHLLHAALIEN